VLEDVDLSTDVSTVRRASVCEACFMYIS